MSTEFRITCVGDINFAALANDAEGLAGACQHLLGWREVFSRGDIVFGNIEGPLSPKKIYKSGKKYLNNPMWAIDTLAELGVNVLSLANNHLMDFGEEALEATLEESRGKLEVCGAGMDWDRAVAPANINLAAGARVGCMALADRWKGAPGLSADKGRPGCAHIHHPDILNIIAAELEKYDSLVVYLHLGLKNLYEPIPEQRAFIHEIVEMGVPLVFCSHCHHIQGYERVGKGVVAYGLGDFFFPTTSYGGHMRIPSEDQRINLVLEAIIEGKSCKEFKLHPYRFEDSGAVRPLQGMDAKKVRQQLAWLSRGFAATDYAKWFANYNSRQPNSFFARNWRRLKRRIAG